MNDNVKKVFEMLGVKPNEKFKIKFESGVISCSFFWLNEELRLLSENEKLKCLDALLFRLLNGNYKIIKLPKKKKLRDWTRNDFKKWTKVNCIEKNTCVGCLFRNVSCNAYGARVWIKHKDLYSDKFLDQEVEIPQKEE